MAIISSDSTNVSPGGRQSVRLESKDEFHEVLIIADFSHLPSAFIPHVKINLIMTVHVEHGPLSGLQIFVIGLQVEKSISLKE